MGNPKNYPSDLILFSPDYKEDFSGTRLDKGFSLQVTINKPFDKNALGLVLTGHINLLGTEATLHNYKHEGDFFVISTVSKGKNVQATIRVVSDTDWTKNRELILQVLNTITLK